MNLKELPLEKKHQSYLLKQIIRSKQAAIYALDEGYGYEVVKIRIRPILKEVTYTKNLHDLGFNHREIYPGSEEWGKYGWYYRNKDEALEKFNNLTSFIKQCFM